MNILQSEVDAQKAALEDEKTRTKIKRKINKAKVVWFCLELQADK